MDSRLAAHLEVAGLLRAVNQAGGFACVLQKGEHEAGTILVVCAEKGATRRVFERMPQLDGRRNWTLSRSEDTENTRNFDDYLERRGAQDPELWIIELDIANGERFIGLAEFPG
ncbi:MAG: DUF1491 family protein [Novosphingobium sp.]|uniref:DUF1491 family protein n=1 Tax=Novosphingobium sp. TaxID=1874826 RepID=UPI0032BBA09A